MKLGKVEALDSVPQHRTKRVEGSLHLERPLPLLQEPARERRVVRKGAGKTPTEDPVGARRNSVRARKPGTNEHSAHPARSAACRNRVAVEQHDPSRLAR